VEKGQMVIITECHKMPELMGKTATILMTNGLELGSRYPIIVMVDGYIEPVGFREEELATVGRG
jgi:hypothetical protein